MKEFVLIQDDDSHWYVAPADKEKQALTFFAKTTAYWANGHQLGKPPVVPKWLENVGGSPSLVRFQKYRIDE